MDMTYTTPKIVRAKSGWFVRYSVNGKEKREKLGLNRITDLDERERAFIELSGEILKRLKKGWNPVLEPVYESEATMLSNMSLADALTHALEQKKDKSHKTHSGYKGAVKFLSIAIRSLSLQSVPVRDVKKLHVKLILKEAEKVNKWSDHAYNKYLVFFKGLFTVLLDDDIIEHNPAHGIKGRDVQDSDFHRPPNKHEFKLIANALKPYPDFMNFVKTVYYTLARESEILKIRASMVDMDNRRITFPAPITKGRKKARVVAMNEFVYNYFLDMGIEDVPGDFYVFGTFKNPRKRSNGESWYVPAPNPIHPNRPTELWKKVVKDGLGINVTLYANKSAGADMMFEEGATVSMVSKMAGHQDERITEKHYMSVVDERMKREAVKHVREYGT